jgi:hypothetical protein
VAPIVDPVAFVAVAVARRMAFYLPCYRLGEIYGPSGIAWVEARAARFGAFIRLIERIFRRASRTVVFCMTGPTVSALAGSAGMRLALFATLAAAGLVLRMLLVLGIAGWAREPIEALLALIERYWIPGTLLIVAGILVHRWRARAVFGPPWA